MPHAARRGQGILPLLSGKAGIGNSRLAEEAGEEARKPGVAVGVCTGLVEADEHPSRMDNQVVDKGVLPSTPTDLAALAADFPGTTVIVGASGCSEWIYDLLGKFGMDPKIVHPANIRRVLGKRCDG
jgi:hypothetical protein